MVVSPGDVNSLNFFDWVEKDSNIRGRDSSTATLDRLFARVTLLLSLVIPVGIEASSLTAAPCGSPWFIVFSCSRFNLFAVCFSVLVVHSVQFDAILVYVPTSRHLEDTCS